MIEINGKNYVKIGNRLVEVDHLDASGKPVLKTWSEQVNHPDGHVDCTIHVPYLQIATKTK